MKKEEFASLLDTEYHLVLGRKGVSVSLHISFDKKDCFHLIGLQRLALAQALLGNPELLILDVNWGKSFGCV